LIDYNFSMNEFFMAEILDPLSFYINFPNPQSTYPFMLTLVSYF